MLSREQIRARDGKITASRIGILANGSPEDVLHLWEELLGMREPDDLSHIWAVKLGECTETLSLDWYEYKTGKPVSRRGEVVICPRAEWAACTLDGFDASLIGPVEAKHVGGFEPRERIISRYTPQVHWQMLCTGTDKCVLQIIEGAREPVQEIVPLDRDYAEELWRRGEAFMQCVADLTPPIALPPVIAPCAPEQWREVEMTGSNAWASFAHDWLTNKDAAKVHDKASKELKALVAADVGRAFGHGIVCKRNKAGSLTISAERG